MSLRQELCPSCDAKRILAGGANTPRAPEALVRSFYRDIGDVTEAGSKCVVESGKSSVQRQFKGLRRQNHKLVKPQVRKFAGVCNQHKQCDERTMGTQKLSESAE